MPYAPRRYTGSRSAGALMTLVRGGGAGSTESQGEETSTEGFLKKMRNFCVYCEIHMYKIDCDM